MSKKTNGRMINKDISNSNGFASLSQNAAVLFCMIIPHLNSHGKLNGGVGFIKDEVCPKIDYLNYKNIPSLLKKISEHTNIKWFESDGRYWIHSINFLTDHQRLSNSRLGQDLLPSYSGVVALQVEVEVEVEVEEKKKLLKIKNGFGLFYEKYPNKVGRKKAEEKWNAINPDQPLFEKILKAVDAQIKTDQWKKSGGTFVPMPATWLFNERWNDELKGASNYGFD